MRERWAVNKREPVKLSLLILATTVAAASLMRGQSTTAPVDARFQFTAVGTPIQSGKAWLFYYGRGYLTTCSLRAGIDGAISVRPSHERVRAEVPWPVRLGFLT